MGRCRIVGHGTEEIYGYKQMKERPRIKENRSNKEF
jgi:hypothetical protein